MLIPDKSTNDVYTAAEFTPFKNETQNAIISGGEPLDVADTSQLSKRITLAASHDDFYTSVYSSGTATYQLTGPAIRAYPFEYKIGMRVRFIVDTENDASAALVKLGSLASLNVSTTRLANGETPVFSTGYFLQYETAELIYNETPDGLTKYWMIVKTPLSQLSNGDISLNDSTIELLTDNSYITLKDAVTPTTYVEIKNDILTVSNSAKSEYVEIENGIITVKKLSTGTTLILFEDALSTAGPLNQLQSEYGFNGVKFLGAEDPSEDKTISYRTSEVRFPGTSHTWNIWTDNGTSIGYTVSGLETNFDFGDESDFIGATMRYLNSSGESHIVPVVLSAFYDAGSGKLGCNIKFANSTGLAWAPVNGSEKIYITYNGNILS